MLYDQALLARVLPARVAGHRRAALSAGARRDDRPTCCATCATRAAASTPPRTPTPRAWRAVLRVDASTRSRGARRRRRRPRDRRGTASPRRATSRAPTSSHRPVRGDLQRPPERRGGRAGALRGARRARAARPRRQGAHRVERPHARRARRGRRRDRRPRTGSTRRSPTAEFLARRTPPRRRPLAALVAGRRRRRATSRSPPTTPPSSTRFTRLAEATGEARWIDEARATADAHARALLGRRATAACSRPATTARPHDPARRTCSTTPRRRPTRSPRVGLAAPRRAHRRRRYGTQAEADPRAARAGRRAHPTAFAHLLAAVDLSTRGVDRDRGRRRPPRPRARGAPSATCPNAVLAWGEPLRLARCGRTRSDGFAYVCRDLRVPGAGRRRRRARGPARRCG